MSAGVTLSEVTVSNPRIARFDDVGGKGPAIEMYTTINGELHQSGVIHVADDPDGAMAEAKQAMGRLIMEKVLA